MLSQLACSLIQDHIRETPSGNISRLHLSKLLPVLQTPWSAGGQIRHGNLPSVYNPSVNLCSNGARTKCSFYWWTNFPGYGYVTGNFPIIEHGNERGLGYANAHKIAWVFKGD